MATFPATSISFGLFVVYLVIRLDQKVITKQLHASLSNVFILSTIVAVAFANLWNEQNRGELRDLGSKEQLQLKVQVVV